jgi:hypothetical protein
MCNALSSAIDFSDCWPGQHADQATSLSLDFRLSAMNRLAREHCRVAPLTASNFRQSQCRLYFEFENYSLADIPSA